MAEAVWAELAEIVGEAHLTDEGSVCESFAVDGQAPHCVAYPGSAEQVAEALEYAAGHGLAVIVCGGGTKLGIGNPPRKFEVALCTRNLTNVRYYEPSDLTAGVAAGSALDELQARLKADGLWLPLDCSAGGKATLGGVVATNASGPLRHFYGAPRDMVVGMQIATTEGKLIRTGGRVVKNVAGYDLGKLLIGSYGTLGVITEVNLKLFPLPAERRTFVLSTGTLGIARDVRRSILTSPIEPLKMVLLDAEAIGLLQSDAPLSRLNKSEPQIWLQAGGSKSVIDRTLKELDTLGRAVGAKVHTYEREAAEGAWQAIADFSNWIGGSYPEAVVLKGTMPIARTEEFFSLAQQEAQNEKVRLASVVQPGVGIVQMALLNPRNTAQAAGLISRMRKAAEKSGGALVVVSAAPDLKAQVDVWGTPGTGFELMKKVKATWDPKGTLAPGRFVGSI